MCNSLHLDSVKPKRKSGKAWKVFVVADDDPTNLLTWLTWSEYAKDSDRWIRWFNKYPDQGFCVLPTKKAAVALVNAYYSFGDWPKAVIKRVAYKGAIGRHKETRVLQDRVPIDTLLVKEFTIL